MFNGRLQPQRTILAVSVLFMWVVALGLAAGAGRAGQTPDTTPPSTRKVRTQTPSLSPKAIPNQTPVRASGKSSRKAPASTHKVKTQTPSLSPKVIPNQTPVRASGKSSIEAPASIHKVKTQTPFLPPTVIPNQTPVRASGKSSIKAPAKAAGAESQRTTTTSMLSTAAGRRDPFKLSMTPGLGSQSAAGGVSGALPSGIRGLVISELRVEGIIRQESANNMIAVVTNYTKRAYFLRVNDTVYNGVVSKITPEAVYFKENTLDSSGRVATHEVAIKLGLAPGEGR